MQRFIDPNNPLQAQMLQRVNRLPPQAIAVLRRVLQTVPQLGMVLKQLFPEIGFIFDMLARGQQQQGQPGARPPQAPSAPPPQGGPPGAPPQGAPPPGGPTQRPMTRLGGQV
jgi:hypothetical protein